MLRFSYVFLIFCYAAKLTYGKDSDVEIEAVIHMDPTFMQKMKESISAGNSIFKNMKSLDIIPVVEARANDNFIEELMSQKLKPDAKATVEQYEQRMFSNGVENLKAIGDYLQKKFAMKESDVAPLVKELSVKYISKLQSYFNFLLKQKTYYDIDKDYVILDMMNMANSLESSVDRTLLNHILDKTKKTSVEDKQVAAETIAYFNLNDKKDEMKYICKTMSVCRIYPGFSEYFAKLLSEVLKLFDVKFQYFITKAVQNLNSKSAFFEKILNKEIVGWFQAETEDIVNTNVTDIREVISVLRSAITHRYKMVSINDDDKIKTRTRASRILLDIIDKVFDQKGNDFVYLQFETIIPAVREWADGVRNDIENILNPFLDLSVNTLKFELSEVAGEEIKTLADIIYKGKSSNNDVAESLMTKGSKFVHGKGFLADLNQILKL